jgi:hypothetical protein
MENMEPSLEMNYSDSAIFYQVIKWFERTYSGNTYQVCQWRSWLNINI